MNVRAGIIAATIVAAGLATVLAAQSRPVIPAFWDAESLHDYELPLATPAMSPVHVSRDYYYALPERRLFKSYPIYHPDREPAGYLDRLRAADPVRRARSKSATWRARCATRA